MPDKLHRYQFEESLLFLLFRRPKWSYKNQRVIRGFSGIATTKSTEYHDRIFAHVDAVKRAGRSRLGIV